MDSFKIPNALKINHYAQDTLRHLRNYDDRAVESFTRFLEEGKTAPGYARTCLTNAKFDNSNVLLEMMEEGVMGLKEMMSKNIDCIKNVDKLWLRAADMQEGQNFAKAFFDLYPKSGLKRLAIDNFLAEPTGVRVQCASKKFGKKIFYFLRKLANR